MLQEETTFSDLEDIVMETIQNGTWRFEKTEKNKQSIHDMLDDIKHSNICTNGSPESGRGKKNNLKKL